MDNMFDKELTEEQKEEMFNDANQFVESLKEETKDISNVVNYDNPEDLQVKSMNIIVDPNTGENKILGSDEDPVDEIPSSFDEIVRKINESDDNDSLLDERPLSESEVLDYLANNDVSDSMMKEVANGSNLSNESIKVLLDITNRRLKGEKFNTYRELPEEIKKMVDSYIGSNIGFNGNIAEINSLKHTVSDSLIDEFISEIQIDRAKNDFARDLESIYNESSKDISNASIEYMTERNAAYRKAAEELEDEEKKKRLLDILDNIDEARSLNKLKEFAKTCKIKKIELEKPDNRVFEGFLSKYRNSNNNIYDIKLARTSLLRNLSAFGYDNNDVNAFLIAFCKQVEGMSSSVATDHAYMYYVLYYSALLDADKETIYKNAVKEVINNLQERNPSLLTKKETV